MTCGESMSACEQEKGEIEEDDSKVSCRAYPNIIRLWGGNDL